MSKRITDSGVAIEPEGTGGGGLQWYATLADAVNGGVYHLDSDNTIVAVDESFVDLTGYTRSELLGEDATLLFDTDDLSRIDRRLDEAIEREGSTVIEHPVTLQTSAGSARSCSVRLTPVAVDETREGTIGIVREDTDRSRDGGPVDAAEQVPANDLSSIESGEQEPASGSSSIDAARQEPAAPASGSIRTVLDEAAVGVFVLNDAFEIAWINEATTEYFGLDRSTAIGRDKRDLIDETIRGRIDDGEAFTETVLATYDDNSYVERFECRVLPGADREQRWLEHRSKPIESGPYAGGRVELYYDVTERHRHTSQLQRLNEAVHEWFRGDSREAIADEACADFVDILGLELNTVFLADDAGGTLEPVAWTDRATALFGDLPTFETGDGIAWRVFESGTVELYDDVRTAPAVYNPETPVRSELVLPIGDHGVVIAASEAEAAFDDSDLALAKIAASNLEAAFDRRQHEHQLERERVQTEQLLQMAPIAIAVDDATGETILANQRAEDVPRVPLWGAREVSHAIDDCRLFDANGNRIDLAETPAARVRATGEPVIDQELVVECSSETRWYSVSATPVYGTDGTVERVISTGEEITQLKEHERQLERQKRALETELGEVLGRVSDAFYALDEELRFTHVNERAEELLGHSQDELLGTRIRAMFPDAGSDLIDRYRQAMETQEPTSWERYSGSLDIWMEIRAYPSETGLSVYFRDITARKERVHQLEVSEQRYRTLAESYPNGVVTMYNDELECTLATGQGFATLPISEAALEGSQPRDVFPDETATEIESTLREALSGTEHKTEIEYADREWLLHAVPITDENGRVVNGMATAQDVTERNERERELATYETLVETMEDGIYALDEEGCFTTVNEAYAELTGYDRDELLGSHGSLVVDESVMDVAKDVATDDTEASAVEAEIETKAGDYVPAEATVTQLSTDDDERGRIGVVRDITDRMERQQRLEASEQRYRTLAENFPNGVVALFDDELQYTAAGGQLMGDMGVDRGEIIGQSIADRYPDELFAEISPHFRAALEGEERSFEVTYHGRDLLAYTLPIEPAGEDHRGMLVVQDVTERKEYQRQLEESNKRLGQFAYAASHDLQEPLRMITSYLQLIERRYGDELDDDGEEFIEFAVDGAERMREMIDGLLEYSRVETRGDPFETVDLADVVANAQTDLQLQIEERDAEITVEPLPTVHGDGGQLRQVIQNLLSNAIEYSGDEPPTIEITAERDGDDWVVSVHDDGIGIDPDDTDRVFEVFQRLHSHENHPGTGIGLALCRRIVERHDGEIWIDSEPDEWTTVSFTLPADR